ncbi:MAG TPA: TonB-dependent receptor [Nevskiales bacterium]|nr:TonB-dependent receptor [Nevskiales bacterium]
MRTVRGLWLWALVLSMSCVSAEETDPPATPDNDTAKAKAEAKPAAAPAGKAEPVVLEAVTVIGGPDSAAALPSSSTVIDAETLKSSRVFTTNEALRKAPGVNVRDEEGFGLRPNISIRGLNPTRSTKVLLLEDGIPLAYAPYGDNASYYHPPIDRFDRIEVLKGSAMNLYGPQTIGGVINYITPIPPQRLSGGLTLIPGNRDYFNGHGYVGGNGMLFDYVRKQGDGARDNIHSRLDDINFKGVFELAGDQQLITRANYYREDSQVTYSGLTDAEFRNFGPRYNPFENDEFDAERAGLSASHEWTLDSFSKLTTHVYWADFSRDWWRQASTTTDGQCGAAFTMDRLNGVAVDPNSCNSRQGRLRDYYTYGVEPRYRLMHKTFGLDNELQLGVRAHFENQDRIQKNGTSPTAEDGTVVEDNERKTDAYSAFVQNRFDFGRLAVTPSLRVENVNYERKNKLTGASGDESLTEVLPALGATYELSERNTLFGGVHKGFAPPRTEDLISNTGTSVDLDAEESLNFEFGLRSRPMPGLAYEATLFHNDFERQIAVGSIAGGSTPLAVGETLYQGLELAGRFEFGPALNWAPGLFAELAYTYLPKADAESAFIRVDNGMPVTGSVAGNRLPYAPRNLATGTLGYAHAAGFDLRLEAVYVGKQFSDFANTRDAPANGNGQVGEIDSHLLWNAAVNYRLASLPGMTLFLAGKNLTDKDYIVDRTRGILTGMPRLVQGGVEYSF